MPTEQHNDHVWLTWAGEVWAIMAIEPPFLHLWRGSAPKNIEYRTVDWPRQNWAGYARRAARGLGLYRDDAFAPRPCDYCRRPYRGPAVYCCLACVMADT